MTEIGTSFSREWQHLNKHQQTESIIFPFKFYLSYYQIVDMNWTTPVVINFRYLYARAAQSITIRNRALGSGDGQTYSKMLYRIIWCAISFVKNFFTCVDFATVIMMKKNDKEWEIPMLTTNNCYNDCLHLFLACGSTLLLAECRTIIDIKSNILKAHSSIKFIIKSSNLKYLLWYRFGITLTSKNCEQNN